MNKTIEELVSEYKGSDSFYRLMEEKYQELTGMEETQAIEVLTTALLKDFGQWMTEKP